MIDLKEFPDDYAQTLSLWRDAFFAQKDAIQSMGKDESFLRAWDYYFSYCEAGFRERQISLCQMLLGNSSTMAT